MSHPSRLVAAVSGPILLAIGYALHPDLAADVATAVDEVADERTRYLVAKLLVTAGSLLFFVPALLIHHSLRGRRGGRLAAVAAVLCTLGFVGNAVSQTHFGYLLWYASDPSVDRSAGVTLVDAAEHAPLLPTLPISFWSVPMFALGLLVLAVALWRSGLVPRWAPVALVVADLVAAAFPVGLPQLAVGAVCATVFAIALNSTPERGSDATVTEWRVSQSR